MILAVIPARYASSRFPGKPLALLAGKPLVQHVYERARACVAIDEVVVATDDERIAQCVRGFGGAVAMTSAEHPSGTDRVAEVARQYPAARLVLNIQGDEPFVQDAQLRALIAQFDRAEVDIASLCKPITQAAILLNPNVVKVAKAASGRALYFSRHAIPYIRDAAAEQWVHRAAHYQHLGLYAYRAAVLQEITALPPSPLEQLEALEQLRWLEAGYTLYLAETNHASIGVDTPDDLRRAEDVINQGLYNA